MCIVELVLADGHAPPPVPWGMVPISHSGSFTAPTLAGAVLPAVGPGVAWFQRATVHVYGPIVVSNLGSHREVVLDAGILHRSAARLIGEPRNAETWRGTTRQVREQYQRVTHIPAEHLPMAILATSFYAFTAFVGDELSGLTAIHATDGRAWRALNDALAHDFRWMITYREAALWGLASASTAEATHSLWHTYPRRQLPPTWCTSRPQPPCMSPPWPPLSRLTSTWLASP